MARAFVMDMGNRRETESGTLTDKLLDPEMFFPAMYACVDSLRCAATAYVALGIEILRATDVLGLRTALDTNVCDYFRHAMQLSQNMLVARLNLASCYVARGATSAARALMAEVSTPSEIPVAYMDHYKMLTAALKNARQTGISEITMSAPAEDEELFVLDKLVANAYLIPAAQEIHLEHHENNLLVVLPCPSAGKSTPIWYEMNPLGIFDRVYTTCGLCLEECATLRGAYPVYNISRLGKVAISNLSIRVVRAIDAESACGAQALARRLAVPAVVSLVNGPRNLSATHLKCIAGCTQVWLNNFTALAYVSQNAPLSRLMAGQMRSFVPHIRGRWADSFDLVMGHGSLRGCALEALLYRMVLGGAGVSCGDN